MKVRIPQGPSQKDLMQQVQQMQLDAQNKQEELDNAEYTATSGGGAVSVTINGLYEIQKITIDPDVIKDSAEDPEMLEDFITVAVNEAVGVARKTSEEEMAKITGRMQIPGMPGLF